MVYAKGFFDLQVAFAEKVAPLAGLSLDRALLDYTNLYVRFGLGRDFDPENPIWRAYRAGLEEAQDRRAWTYGFYRSRADTPAGPPVAATFGCFSYANEGEDRIRLHFQNRDTGSHSSLAAVFQQRRRAELSALFEHVRRSWPGEVRVAGVSWLYNLDAYRRLFPEAYVATARPLTDRFRSMPRWGQFLDRRGELRESTAGPFQVRLAQRTGIERLHECFPFQPLAVDAPARVFYDHYGLCNFGGGLDV